ncbi:MAG: alpha/beta hydrolase [Pseudanabaenaceae cyanobacterium bins.39]|nr:alpha/beta hydrolase [Pseudanabaenaceae cyanobacterium bins.39]
MVDPSSLIDPSPNQQIKTRSSWLKSLTITGIAIASSYSLICAGLWFGQTKLIFKPTRVIENTPAKYQAKYEDVLIPVISENGNTENIHGWWIPNLDQAKLPLAEQRVILYLHGNAKNVGANAKHANRLKNFGFSVLVIDYRGYGKSSGNDPTESSVYADAQAAWDYLLKQGYQPQQIIVYGHSLGGAIAINLISNQQNKTANAKGLIIDGSFTSIVDMASLDPKYRIFPINLLIHQNFDSISKVSSIKSPILYIHGTADEVIPASMSQALYNATTAPKQLLLVPNAGHNNTASTNETLYANAIRQFFLKP